MMLRGFLKNNSSDINNFQRLVDPLVLATLFCKVFTNNIVFEFNFFLIFFVSLTLLNFNKIYNSFRIKNLNNLIPILISITSLITLVSPVFEIYEPPLTRYKLMLFFSLCFLYLFFHHYILRFLLRFLRSKGFNYRNCIFFGNKESLQMLINQLEKYPWIGYRIIYWFSPNKEDYKMKDPESSDLICNGDLNELIKITQKSKNIDNLFFCHKETDEISFKNLLNSLGDFCIPVTYLIDWDINSISLKKEYFGDINGLNLWNPEHSIINERIKRFFDLGLAIILIFILFPILIIISIAIKTTSKGPIIFSQARYGLNGSSFKMYKFRTMYITNNQYPNYLVQQAKKNDKRITKIGKFLRKYSLDEIPQLINVIRGEMSLVGPRPHAIEHNEFYRKKITGYMQRHSKLPGMTGLAQINGARGETSTIEMMRRRIDFDIEYNNNWSLFKDFLILSKTIFVVLRGKAF